MAVEWPEEPCIVCLAAIHLTQSHVIPAAIGGHLRAKLECVHCNGRLGHAVEAGLRRDPIVRSGVEALGEGLPSALRTRLRNGQAFTAEDRGRVVKAAVSSDRYRVRDTPQEDGSFVKDPERAKQEVAATLRRRGASVAEVASALARLDEAPANQVIQLAPGLEAKKGAVNRFAPDYGAASLVPDTCPLAIAYRFLALVLAGAGSPEHVYARAFTGVRAALAGQGAAQDGWRIDWLVARRAHEPWHGVALSEFAPQIVVHVRLFGQIAWDVTFTRAALSREPLVTAYEDRLGVVGGERFA